MLRPRGPLVIIALLVGLTPRAALAEVQCADMGWEHGSCSISAEVTDPGEGGASAPAAAAPSRGESARVCSFGGVEVACVLPVGVWSGRAQGWCRLMDPQPAVADAVWESRTDGAVYLCVRPNGVLVPDPGMSFTRWLPAAPEEAVTAADAEAAARQVAASIGLEAIDMGMVPRGTSKQVMMVGWHTWLWADQPSLTQWGPVTASGSASGVNVTLDARVTEVVWDMGDGSRVSCGMGRRWTDGGSRGGLNVASPECDYVYREDGYYTVTATSRWRVDWSAAGFSGSLPLELSRSVEVIVCELQAVNVAGG